MKRILLFLCAIFFTANVFATGIGANDTTANCDNNTLGQTSGTSNMEIDWQPNTINIRWYDGETQLNVQSSAQSCVYNDDLYLPTTRPTKTGYTFKGWTVIDVPAGYTKLEYIESTGTQYIDTGFIFTGNIIKYDLVYNTPMEHHGASLFGASNNDTNWTGIPYYAHGNDFVDRLAIGTTVDAIIIPEVAGLTYNYSLIINRVGNTWELSRNESTYYGTFNGSISNTTNIVIFAHNRNNEIWQYSSYKNYGFKITQDNVLVRDFIPARRDSDNVVGMYDTVTGQFFTNSGSGTFIAGPAVLPSGYTKLEYLESTGTQWVDTGVELTSDNVTYVWEGKDNSTNNSTLFGTEYGLDSDSGRQVSGTLHPTNSSRRAWIGTSRSANIGYSSSDGLFHAWSFVIGSDRTAYLIKDGETLPSVTWSGSLPRIGTIILFANRYEGLRISQFAKVAFKYFTIIDNGQTVFNGIPAQRDSDGALGMYDTVSHTFKINRGTGTFTAGPVAQ